MQAEVVVLANSKEEALELLNKEDQWNMEEINRLEPIVIPLDQPAIVTRFIEYL